MIRAPYFLLVTLAACGARSALDVPSRSEPGVDAGRDASLARDGGAIRCPARSEAGFTLMPAGEIAIDAPYATLSLGGDGSSVWIASELPARGEQTWVAYRLDALGQIDDDFGAAYFSGVADGQLDVVDGRPLLLLTEWFHVLRLADLATGEVVVAELPPGTGSLAGFARPVSTGDGVLVAGNIGGNLFLGPFVAGGLAVAWRPMTWASPIGVAADPVTGASQFVHRDGTGFFHLETFARDGSATGAVVMESIGFELASDASVFGVVDDAEAPYVLAGFWIDDTDVLRAQLGRFRHDGSAGSVFSAPLDGDFGGVDLTTDPAPPSRFGYGMIAGVVGGTTIFHGASDDFVGDAQAVPVACDGLRPAIAAGPCGYVLACTAGGVIHTVLAVPPLPR